MEIKDDNLIINTAHVDAVGGAKPEPEERPAIRTLAHDAVVSGNRDGVSRGKMSANVNAEMTVGEFVKNANPCSGCIHFDNEAWIKMLGKWKASTDPFEKFELNKARSLFVSPNTISEMIAAGQDIDTPLQPMGVCRAITRTLMDLGHSPAKATTVVSPLAVCPEALPDGTPLTRPLYKARRDAVINKIKDDVLFKANGKIK